MIAVLLLAVTAVFAAAYERRKRMEIYDLVDGMLDNVLDRKPVTVSDLREGRLSALAGKARRIQENLEASLERAQREKEEVKGLISNMSHQLGTPLNNVMMYRELLEEEQSLTVQKEYLRRMKRQMEKLDWILQSLFKMVRLEQGYITFEVSAASLKETLLSAIDTVYEKAEHKGIRIVTEPFADCMLVHNRRWTAEVFVNLLENAIKYSDEGSSIEIRVRPMELFTEISFSDHGIGIRAEEQNDIFRRFYRSREVENREGSGIGLYLSRLILEQEKGYMTASSRHGRGSTFFVFLQNCQNQEAKLSGK